MLGHTLLAKLGKRRLRPGGVRATNWLLSQIDLYQKHLLEVACNIGTTSIEIASKYPVTIDAIDLDEIALDKAKKRVSSKKLEKQIKFIQGDATQLPFKEETYDVVLNEAMLTMLSDRQKEKAISEYHRVLKPKGILLTHDVCLLTEDSFLQKQIKQELSKVIYVNVRPKTIDEWKLIFVNFKEVKVLSGYMSLMDPYGMIKDEGLFTTIKIMSKGLFGQHRKQFRQMFKVFRKYREHLGFVAIYSQK